MKVYKKLSMFLVALSIVASGCFSIIESASAAYVTDSSHENVHDTSNIESEQLGDSEEDDLCDDSAAWKQSSDELLARNIFTSSGNILQLLFFTHPSSLEMEAYLSGLSYKHFNNYFFTPLDNGAYIETVRLIS